MARCDQSLVRSTSTRAVSVATSRYGADGEEEQEEEMPPPVSEPLGAGDSASARAVKDTCASPRSLRLTGASSVSAPAAEEEDGVEVGLKAEEGKQVGEGQEERDSRQGVPMR